MERVLDLLLAAWALVDLLQIPLLVAVLAAWRLTRPLGRAWKATAVAFGGYTAWAILTARLVPFAPTGFIVVVLGTVLDPRRGAPPEHAWIAGSAAAVVLFLAVPTAAVAWATRRRAPPGRPARAA